MTRIRICEESEARLMIRDGSLRDYVKMWSARFPQETLLSKVTGLRDKYNMDLKESLSLARSRAENERVLLEIGDKLTVKKINDKEEVYVKTGDIWVKAPEGLKALDSEDIFEDRMKGRSMFMVCREEEILGAKDIRKLAGTVYKRACSVRGCCGFGKHEIWDISDRHEINIYSHTLDKQSTFLSVDDIEEHILRYRKEHGISFGVF